MEKMDVNKNAAALEAILFVTGDAAKISDIAEAMAISPEDVRAAAEALSCRYDSESGGLELKKINDSYQLCTRREFSDILIKLISKSKEHSLTDVMMETLSIIAYRQPVTRSDIEKIRGVSCEHGINALLGVGLIEEKGRLQAPGRPILFGTTDDFLRAFGMESLDELPEPDESIVPEGLTGAEQTEDAPTDGADGAQEKPGGEPEQIMLDVL